jgi:uncharacterized lipoprotein YajG
MRITRLCLAAAVLLLAACAKKKQPTEPTSTLGVLTPVPAAAAPVAG